MISPEPTFTGPEDHLPTRHGNCVCDCHRIPGISHLIACCNPTA